MQVFGDWLEYYNNLDVSPFLEALVKMRDFYTDLGVDIFRDANSLYPSTMLHDVPCGSREGRALQGHLAGATRAPVQAGDRPVVRLRGGGHGSPPRSVGKVRGVSALFHQSSRARRGGSAAYEGLPSRQRSNPFRRPKEAARRSVG